MSCRHDLVPDLGNMRGISGDFVKLQCRISEVIPIQKCRMYMAIPISNSGLQVRKRARLKSWADWKTCCVLLVSSFQSFVGI